MLLYLNLYIKEYHFCVWNAVKQNYKFNDKRNIVLIVIVNM